WCNQSKAISQDRPAATPAWAANSAAARTRRTRSASVARDRWPSSLRVSTVVSTRSRAVAMVIKASHQPDRHRPGWVVPDRRRVVDRGDSEGRDGGLVRRAVRRAHDVLSQELGVARHLEALVRGAVVRPVGAELLPVPAEGHPHVAGAAAVADLVRRGDRGAAL